MNNTIQCGFFLDYDKNGSFLDKQGQIYYKLLEKENDSDECNDVETVFKDSSIHFPLPFKIKQISSLGCISLFLSEDGKIYCLRIGQQEKTPMLIPFEKKIKKIFCGNKSFLFSEDESVYAFDNFDTSYKIEKFTFFDDKSPIKDISSTVDYNVILLEDGSVYFLGKWIQGGYLKIYIHPMKLPIPKAKRILVARPLMCCVNLILVENEQGTLAYGDEFVESSLINLNPPFLKDVANNWKKLIVFEDEYWILSLDKNLYRWEKKSNETQLVCSQVNDIDIVNWFTIVAALDK